MRVPGRGRGRGRSGLAAAAPGWVTRNEALALRPPGAVTTTL